MKTLAKTIALSLLGAAALVAPSASAETVKYASLPTGTVTQHPVGEGPKNIAATEKAPGFFLAKPPPEQTMNGRMAYVMLFSKEKDAKDFTAGKGFGFMSPGEDANDVCFSERAVDIDIDEPGGPAEWSPSLETGVHLTPHFMPMPPRAAKGGKPVRMNDMPRKFEVTAMHQERFVDLGAGKAQLEMMDAWVDPATRGVRPIGKATLALQKVADAPGGFAIYAAKERTHVQLVVRRVKEADKDDGGGSTSRSIAQMRMMQMRRMPLMIEGSSGARDASSCGFARVALHAEQGVGEMAKLETSVVTTMPAEEQPEKKESPLQALLGVGDSTQDLTQPELHMRPISINMSTSWTSRDKEPVVSITFGWAGRDKKM